MVVKINAPTPHCSTTLQYNERKVEEGKAAVVYSQGLDNPDKPLETFERYERGSRRCEKMSFHMSVNPSRTDGMTEDQVVAFTKELMEGLGYGDQPFIIYRHNDINREHYHIVSVRVDNNGRKISDKYEHRHCQELMKELAPKYGFAVGKEKDVQEKEPIRIEGPIPDYGPVSGPEMPLGFESPEAFEEFLKNNPPPEFPPLEEDKKEDGKVEYQRFDPEKGDYMKQIEELVEQAKKYHFTTGEQFKMLMRQFGVDVDYQMVKRQAMMTFAGINPKNGHRCTAPIPAKDLKVPSVDEIRQHIEDAKKEKRNKEKQRAANLVRIALKYGKSELHTRRILRKKNIGMVFSRTKEGKIFGVTFIDHQTRCVFKSSELKGISAGQFEEARMTKWPPEDREWKVYEEPKEKSTAEEAADTLVAAMAAERSRRNEDEEIMRRGRHR